MRVALSDVEGKSAEDLGKALLSWSPLALRVCAMRAANRVHVAMDACCWQGRVSQCAWLMWVYGAEACFVGDGVSGEARWAFRQGCLGGHVSVLRWLWSQRSSGAVSLDVADEPYNSLFSSAATGGDVCVLRFLWEDLVLGEGVEGLRPEWSDHAAFKMAASNGQLAAVQWLWELAVSRGAPIDMAALRNGPMRDAASRRHLAVCQWLWEVDESVRRLSATQVDRNGGNELLLSALGSKDATLLSWVWSSLCSVPGFDRGCLRHMRERLCVCCRCGWLVSARWLWSTAVSEGGVPVAEQREWARFASRVLDDRFFGGDAALAASARFLASLEASDGDWALPDERLAQLATGAGIESEARRTRSIGVWSGVLEAREAGRLRPFRTLDGDGDGGGSGAASSSSSSS